MLLTQNSKLKPDGIFNFDIPAYRSRTGLITCPNARDCVANCYARQGTYRFSTVQNKHEANLEASLSTEFVDNMIKEITDRKAKIIRIHSSGDFYSELYAQKWIVIAKELPDVLFYAYTKSWNFFPDGVPENLKLIQSEGGILKIDLSKPHARVFIDESVIPDSYVDASESDIMAIMSNDIALIYHGNKKPTLNGFINKE